MREAKYLSKRKLYKGEEDKKGLGLHLIMEFYGCDEKLLEKAKTVEEILLKAAKESNFTILQVKSHQFNPRGATSMVIIGESHLTIHTWPEFGFAAIDIFSCGRNPRKAAEVLIRELKPRKVEIIELVRGSKISRR